MSACVTGFDSWFVKQCNSCCLKTKFNVQSVANHRQIHSIIQWLCNRLLHQGNKASVLQFWSNGTSEVALFPSLYKSIKGMYALLCARKNMVLCSSNTIAKFTTTGIRDSNVTAQKHHNVPLLTCEIGLNEHKQSTDSPSFQQNYAHRMQHAEEVETIRASWSWGPDQVAAYK